MILRWGCWIPNNGYVVSSLFTFFVERIHARNLLEGVPWYTSRSETAQTLTQPHLLHVACITLHLEGPPRLVASLYLALSEHLEKSSFYKSRHFYKGVSQGQISKVKDEGQKQRHKQDPSLSDSSSFQNIHLPLSDFQINFTVITFTAIPASGTSFQVVLNNTS